LKKREKKKESPVARILSVLGIGSFILAGVLTVIAIIMSFDKVRMRYDQYLVIFQDLEQKIASLNSKWLILIVILLLFICRANSWIYPIPVIYIVSAMVFNPLNSFIINMFGTLMMCAFRYYTGMQMGEGMLSRLIKKNPDVSRIFEAGGKQNPATLFVLRLFPFFPFNSVSHIYGSFDFPFIKFMVISAAAMAPRLITYSFIGNNVYDPLSTKFSIPIVALLVLTGLSTFLMRDIMGILPEHRFRRKKKQELTLSDKQEAIDEKT